MTEVSTHVLDLASGRPAAGVHVELHARTPESSWRLLGSGRTDPDGRAAGLAGPGGAGAGLHRLAFAIGAYQQAAGVGAPLLDEAAISFNLDGEERLHLPLLLSPYGVSIYRGS